MVVAVIAVTVSIPAVIVCHYAVGAFPVAVEKSFSIVAGSHPDGAFIRRAGPVAVVPAVMAADRVPVAIDPNESRARRGRPNHHARRRRRADPNA